MQERFIECLYYGRGYSEKYDRGRWIRFQIGFGTVRTVACVSQFDSMHPREYYSYKIDIIPKTEYNVLEGEVYSLCI